MSKVSSCQKVVVIGAGPVGSLAALYAASRGDEVDVYELRGDSVRDAVLHIGHLLFLQPSRLELTPYVLLRLNATLPILRDIYSDLRNETTTPLNFTKSINLALSERGIHAIRSSSHQELISSILSSTIPMHGRMVHSKTAKGYPTSNSQPYDTHGRFIRAVDRGALNKRLLDELEQLPNVNFHFHHKLTGADFTRNLAWLEDLSSDPSPDNNRRPEIEISFDLLLGADGAHSTTRHNMMKHTRLNLSQEYIDTLWCEFHISPTSGPSQTYRLPPHYLHIWPGGTFMFIALPNPDKSFTCTLFAPSSIFSHLSSSPSSNLPSFFTTQFPGVVPILLSPSDLTTQFSTNPHLPLLNLKVSPHHANASGVILGDAANAMVPFYGQGMNAGLESVRVLFQFLDSHGVYNTPTSDSDSDSFKQTQAQARGAALSAYSAHRIPDTHAIADLALENYYEMRAGVTSPAYKLRKHLEEGLDRYLPALGWGTQYSRVSFGNERYSVVRERARWQGKVLLWVARVSGLGVLGVLAVLIKRLGERWGVWEFLKIVLAEP
ncbi:MAG: hypothetical protein Q9227_004903 [Pyrenula ochraceoflavens]